MIFSDFTVNAINVDELRKSMRRQKFEKKGLSIAILTQTTATTSTGGTSDDDDEGSTPSGDNADRSLASTLGGSSESIPQQISSISFLQAALDGPGSLSDKERGALNKKIELQK
jgi:mitogen-activated protein kinase binding protein 1